MAIFGKGDDYVDYTLLKKKGILKVPEEKRLPLKSDGGFIDFTAFGNNENANSSIPLPTQETPAPNFDFLSNMAGVGAPSSPSPDSPSYASPLANFDTIQPASSTALLSQDDKEINALKIKIDDLDYKINNFIEKIDKIEGKLNKLNLG